MLSSTRFLVAGECETNGACYITVNGAGALTGVDWTTAYAGLPPILQCGVVYYLAGGTYNYTSSSTTLNNTCTSTSPLIIYKAVAGGPGNPDSVPGWQSSYGADPALFIQVADPDPEKRFNPFFALDGNYITLDGLAPTAGTPTKGGGYGIHLQSPNFTPFVTVSGSNVTLRHIEYDAVTPNYGYSVTACSRSNNVVSVTTASTPPWINGDTVDLLMGGGSPTDFATPTGGAGVPISNLSGNTFQFAQTGPNETCTVAPNTRVVLNYPEEAGPVAIIMGGGTSPSANVVVSDSYLHEFSSTIHHHSGCAGCTYQRLYFARNWATPTSHHNFIDGPSVTNTTIAQSIFEDGSGTSNIDVTAVGNWDSDLIWSNLFVCTLAAAQNRPLATPSPQCNPSSIMSDDNGQNVMSHSVVYGNTVVRAYPCYVYFTNPSTSVTFENNLLWCADTSIPQGAVTDFSNASIHDYNSVWAIKTSLSTTPGPHDNYVTTSSFPSLFVDPTDAGENFHLASPTPDSASCTAGTNCINDGLALSSPYSTDLSGIVRGGSCTTGSLCVGYDRGAYEYHPATPPTPPQLQVIGIH